MNITGREQIEIFPPSGKKNHPPSTKITQLRVQRSWPGSGRSLFPLCTHYIKTNKNIIYFWNTNWSMLLLLLDAFKWWRKYWILITNACIVLRNDYFFSNINISFLKQSQKYRGNELPWRPSFPVLGIIIFVLSCCLNKKIPTNTQRLAIRQSDFNIPGLSNFERFSNLEWTNNPEMLWYLII